MQAGLWLISLLLCLPVAQATPGPEIHSHEGQVAAAMEASAIADKIADLKDQAKEKRKELRGAKKAGKTGEIERIRGELSELSKQLRTLQGESARLRKAAGLQGPGPRSR